MPGSRKLSLTLFQCLLLYLCLASVNAQTNWWNPNWTYRIPLSVEATGAAQHNHPVAVTINFTVALKAVKARGIFVSNTLRVVEINERGEVMDEAVPLQFDFAPDFHATRHALGTVQFFLKGRTTSTRHFHLYFETNEAEHLTQIIAPYRRLEVLQATGTEVPARSLEPLFVNVGGVETRPAPLATRLRTVTMGTAARSATAEFNATEPLWKNKPEHQFFPGYCTWYAARKWKEFTGTPVTWSGDAGRWFDNALEEGRRVSDDPKAAVRGAVMVWTRHGAAGHVAIVEKVADEGVYISEMNVYRRWVVSEAFLPFTNLDKGTKYKFRGYILPE
jgi:surface antigen